MDRYDKGQYLGIFRIPNLPTLNLPASIGRLAACVGLLVSGFLSEQLGRRRILIAGSGLQILTCCLFYFAASFLTLTLMVAAALLVTVLVMIPSYALLSEVSQFLYNSPFRHL